MKFENDVFISYAHIDDQSLIEDKKGWISNLHRALDIRVGQLLGKQPRIWRDAKLEGNDFFGDQLVDRLEKVGLVVSVLSPRYTQSEWCTKEVKEFFRASEKSGGARVGNKSRVLKVIKTPVPLEEHPSEIQGTLGYEFFTTDPASGRPQELDQGLGSEEERKYWAKLDDLAYDIAELLKALETAEGGGDGSAPAAKDKGTIYLAEASFDLKEQREEVKRDLQRQGFTVLPDSQPPFVAAELEEFVRKDLEGCRLSIHMIGKSYGLVPDGATESMVAIQTELAIKRGLDDKDFIQLVWLPPGQEVDDERQREFIERLQTDSRIHEGGDLLEVPLVDFQTVMYRKLEPEEAEEEAEEEEHDDTVSAGLDDDDLTRIYLICDQRDVDSTLDLEDLLFDRGFEVIVPIFDEDETQARLDHEENLRECDAALFYYGEGNEMWLRRKQRELQKIFGLGRKKPILARAIYVAPPDNPRKKRLRTREAMVIQGGGDFDPQTLEPFVEAIEQAREKAAS
ncbi:MAG: TIR domain-containing protein [bacterium]|nr:TIR domain-containing protein [bacterium]